MIKPITLIFWPEVLRKPFYFWNQCRNESDPTYKDSEIQNRLSFKFRVVLCRFRFLPTLISKIKWLWSGLHLINLLYAAYNMHRMIYSIYYLKHKLCFNIIRLYAKSFYQINNLYSQLKIFIFSIIGTLFKEMILWLLIKALRNLKTENFL